MAQCAKDLKIPLMQSDPKSHPEFKCLLKCSFEKDGYLKDGALLESPMLKGIQDEKDLDVASRGKLTKAVPTCMDSVKTTADPCDKSFAFISCLYKSVM